LCQLEPVTAITIANHRSNYMAMRRACSNNNIVVTPIMLEQYNAGGGAKQRLFEKFVLHANDLAKIGLDVMKDQPFCLLLFWSSTGVKHRVLSFALLSCVGVCEMCLHG
jgi:hypothetical protein